MTLNGTVTAISANSITLELASGTSITIPLDDETAYHILSPATADAVGVGRTVNVTPGLRYVDPTATADPEATPGAGLGGITFGTASDVSVVEP